MSIYLNEQCFNSKQPNCSSPTESSVPVIERNECFIVCTESIVYKINL